MCRHCPKEVSPYQTLPKIFFFKCLALPVSLISGCFCKCSEALLPGRPPALTFTFTFCQWHGTMASPSYSCDDTVKTSCQLSKLCMQKEDWYLGKLWHTTVAFSCPWQESCSTASRRARLSEGAPAFHYYDLTIPSSPLCKGETSAHCVCWLQNIVCLQILSCNRRRQEKRKVEAGCGLH